jgi:AcrR family transcriptional regulator
MVRQARTDRSERGRETTRLRILDAARELFACDGVEATSVRSIADRCGLTDAAIYYYYPAKQDILDALLVPPSIRPLSALGESKAARAALINQLADFFSSWAENADLLRVLLREGLEGNPATMTFSSEIKDAVEAQLDSAVRRLFGSEFPQLPHAICMLLCGLMYDTLLACGDDFAAFVEQPAFRRRVVALFDVALPQDQE